MDYKLEVVVVPVSDIDRAKAFYADGMGFVVDVDHQPNDDVRIVQMTPPGSACSVTIGKGMTKMAPGSLEGLQLVVDDIAAARAELLERGMPVSTIQHHDGSGFVEGPGARGTPSCSSPTPTATAGRSRSVPRTRRRVRLPSRRERGRLARRPPASTRSSRPCRRTSGRRCSPCGCRSRRQRPRPRRRSAMRPRRSGTAGTRSSPTRRPRAIARSFR